MAFLVKAKIFSPNIKMMLGYNVNFDVIIFVRGGSSVRPRRLLWETGVSLAKSELRMRERPGQSPFTPLTKKLNYG